MKSAKSKSNSAKISRKVVMPKKQSPSPDKELISERRNLESVHQIQANPINGDGLVMLGNHHVENQEMPTTGLQTPLFQSQERPDSSSQQ